MPTISNQLTSLSRRCAALTSPKLRFPPHTFLLPHPHRHTRIQRIPLVACRTSYSTTTSSSKLVVSGELKGFSSGISDFSEIRLPGLAYFDKTGYIPVLENRKNVQLLCRPRRFGKSLTVSMLRYFHGFQFRNKYDQLFKDLDVDEAVKNGAVKNGQYLILGFDFSRVLRPRNIDESVEHLREEINYGLSEFKLDYTEHLGDSFASETSGFVEDNPSRNLKHLVGAVNRALQGIHDGDDQKHPLRDIYLLADEYDAYANEYMDPHDQMPWSDSEPFRVLKAFWSNVKAGKSPYGIKKVYITGVTPLLLSGLTSGANDQENISFSPQMSTICGLTRSDVLGALEVICYNNEEEVQKRFRELERNANGYRFCQERSVDPVFNTQTALSYLEAVNLGQRPEAEDPPNSEVSEPFLRACARVPAAVNYMQFALQKDEHDGSHQKIPCQKVLRGFKLSQLRTQAAGEGDISAWQSLMVYMGGLTFDSDEPSKYIKIPNLIAAKRFGTALLDQLGLYSSMQIALHTLARTGNPMNVLKGYCHLMQQRDVTRDAFAKTEEHHRDSILIAILENPAIKPVAEYQVRKITRSSTLSSSSRTSKSPTWDLGGENDIHKAKRLEAMGLDKILGLKLNKHEKFRSGTIKNWFDGRGKKSVRKQLQSYVAGSLQKEIGDKNFRAFAVVIVGSRQILVREMDRNGNWVSGFQLADEYQRCQLADLDSSTDSQLAVERVAPDV